MPDYDFYDKVVAETLTILIQDAINNKGLVVNNYLELNRTKYFIEIAKMACDLSHTQLYLRMKLFSFYKYKIKNWKMMKHIKRHKDKIEIPIVNVVNLENTLTEKLNLKDKNIFNDIYEEYYTIK